MAGVVLPGNISDVKCNIPELRGDNYKVWKERVLLQLGWMDIDYAIRKDEPPAITEDSTQDAISLYEKWERSNRLSVMFIKTKICTSIRGSVDKHTNVKELIKAIDEQFATSDKALASTLIMQFSSMKLTETKGVRDYIMRMRDITAQLKDLEVTMSDSFLVHFILCTLPNQYDPFKVSYNTHKDKCSINELMTMCVQEEGRLAMEESEKNGQACGPFAKFLQEHGIVAQYTMPGSPDQNGVAERRNRTLIEMVRSMQSNATLPPSLWIEALKTPAYILNRVPSKAVSKTPFELFKGWKPSLRHMRVWGCPSEVRIYNPQEKKLDPRTISGYFIGYAEKSKGYRFYCPSHSTRIVESRNAKFLENDLVNGSDQFQGNVPEKDRIEVPTSNSSDKMVIVHVPQVQPDVRQPIANEVPQNADNILMDNNTNEEHLDDQHIDQVPLRRSVRVRRSAISDDFEKTEEKVVDSVVATELSKNITPYCRCWRSGTFPLCDGSHMKHNKATVGPLLLKKQ
uniref:Integrase catalytic domain-containing protein n=1 Tax=Chenopodium quinoa TaxID=63459 RepID=A0A803M5E7_CHEQI